MIVSRFWGVLQRPHQIVTQLGDVNWVIFTTLQNQAEGPVIELVRRSVPTDVQVQAAPQRPHQIVTQLGDVNWVIFTTLQNQAEGPVIELVRRSVPTDVQVQAATQHLLPPSTEYVTT